MSEITFAAQAELDACHDLMSLLDVCIASASASEGPEGLSRTLKIAQSYAAQLRDTIEMVGRRGLL